MSGPRTVTTLEHSASQRPAGRRAGSADGRPRPAPAPARPYRRSERLLLLGTAIASALVLVAATSASAFFRHLNGNIATQSMAELGPLPPASKAGVLNILALGSQTRDGQGSGFGRDPGTDLSDTAMLIHVNADHSRAVVLSIPRDLLVYRPACRERVGGNAIVPAQSGAMFDSAMNLGGPACAIATVEYMSGIRMDHFIRLDFNGFRTMTQVLGGVEVCVPKPGIQDWRSHLDIGPGLHLVSGDEALAFVRDRHGIGNGGDLGRIRMQQMFVSSLIRKVMSSGTLSDPVTLYRIADAATRSITTDPGLGSVQALLSLAESLRGLKLHDITFVTLPNQLDPQNIDRLIPLQPQAGQVWELLRDDEPWTGQLRAGTTAMAAAGTSPAPRSMGGASFAPGIPGLPSAEQPAANASPGEQAASAPAARAGQGNPVQARNAGDNICSGLPTPSKLAVNTGSRQAKAGSRRVANTGSWRAGGEVSRRPRR